MLVSNLYFISDQNAANLFYSLQRRLRCFLPFENSACFKQMKLSQVLKLYLVSFIPNWCKTILYCSTPYTKCNRTVAQKQRPRRAILTSFINWCHVSSFVLIMMLIMHKQTIFSHWQITYQWKVTSYLQWTDLVIFYQNLTKSVSVTW